MTTTIGIVGSRSWNDYAAFRALLLDIPEVNACLGVVSGKCPLGGVDEMAERWAKETGRYFRGYPPDPSKPFKQAARERNQKIADDLAACRFVGSRVALIALPGPKSSGTWDTVRRCRKLGVKVIVKEVPE